jgi:hypothetical protein
VLEQVLTSQWMLVQNVLNPVLVLQPVGINYSTDTSSSTNTVLELVPALVRTPVLLPTAVQELELLPVVLASTRK